MFRLLPRSLTSCCSGAIASRSPSTPSSRQIVSSGQISRRTNSFIQSSCTWKSGSVLKSQLMRCRPFGRSVGGGGSRKAYGLRARDGRLSARRTLLARGVSGRARRRGHQRDRHRQPGGAAQCGDAPARLHRVARRAGVSGEQRYGAVQVRRDQRETPQARGAIGTARIGDDRLECLREGVPALSLTIT